MMTVIARLKNFSQTSGSRAALQRYLSSLRSFWIVGYVVFLPVAIYHGLLFNFWRGGEPRSWDGTGHFGIAQIYDQSIFPDTFGWTFAHFGGMPFPNFYPPLFFWCVSLVNHLHLLSVEHAFKLLVMLPLLLLPGFMWILGWVFSEKERSVALWTALASLVPLLDPRFGGQLQWASGLDYTSTYSIGMYTQPLGFVLLIVWIVTYVRANSSVPRFIFASVLLALAVLANYLNVVTTAIIIAATLLVDTVRYLSHRMLRGDKDVAAWRAMRAHLLTPLLAVCLTLFWTVPMLAQYEYFVTRPFTSALITRPMVIWFTLAVFGFVRWFRKRTPAFWPHLLACSVILFIVSLAAIIAPPWLPFQANRFAPPLNFLLALPVGYGLASLMQWLRILLTQKIRRTQRVAVKLVPHAEKIFLVLLMLAMLAASQQRLVKLFVLVISNQAVYPVKLATASQIPLATVQPLPHDSILLRSKNTDEILNTVESEHKNDFEISRTAAASVEYILSFAQQHPNGRYLVEVPDLYSSESAAFDGRAINSYLGAQGNETVSVVFREASPNSIFMNPQVNAFSYNPDNFGLSSALSDDLDFSEQPLALHLKRARLLGTHYLVIHSPLMKDRLAKEADVSARYDFGAWSIFELVGETPRIEVLPFRPAVLVSRFSLKGRQRGEPNYIRFAEEQFASGWFDVRLIRTPEIKLDRLIEENDLMQYGALVVDTYNCDNCDYAYRGLRDFAQHRLLILLMSEDPLFNRIQYNLADFPMAQVIERTSEAAGGWLDNLAATRRYQHAAIREQWAQIQSALERHKVPTEPANVSGEIHNNTIEVRYTLSQTLPEYGVPVLINTTYHPNWQREDGAAIYAANPMFMLTFIRQNTRLLYSRRWFEWVALLISLLTMLVLVWYAGWHWWRFNRRGRTTLPYPEK